MNQTQKRLNIIKLAISIGDNETIQLQLLKLAPLKTDEKIQEIIKGLQADNYAKTLPLITEYIEAAPEEILQRTSQEEMTAEENEILIEEFDLFRVNKEKEKEISSDIFDLDTEDQTEELSVSQSDLDILLSLKSDDVLTDTPDIQQTLPSHEKNDFFETHHIPTPNEEDRTDPQDDFFQTVEKETDSIPEEEPFPNQSFGEAQEDEKEEEISQVPPSSPEEETMIVYEPIPYIDQKLKTMQTQYPPTEEPESSFPTVDAWLIKISNEGYTETEVEKTIDFIQELVERGEIAQAAQLLLISAATQSKYAQLMLARALFKGDILQQNLPESFTLINRLAMDDDYPEAICDLGQMYENGIGIDKDRKRAEELYREAMELGIKRAETHYKRVQHANRGFLGKLLGK